jgi:hypothetical protein
MADPKETSASAPEKKASTRPKTSAEPRSMSSPSLDCRPNVCELGDQTSNWKGYPNYECPRCGFATIDEGELKKRRPARRQP